MVQCLAAFAFGFIESSSSTVEVGLEAVLFSLRAEWLEFELLKTPSISSHCLEVGFSGIEGIFWWVSSFPSSIGAPVAYRSAFLG